MVGGARIIIHLSSRNGFVDGAGTKTDLRNIFCDDVIKMLLDNYSEVPDVMNIIYRLVDTLHLGRGYSHVFFNCSFKMELKGPSICFIRFKIFVLRYCSVPDNKSSSDGLEGAVDSKCCIIS